MAVQLVGRRTAGPSVLEDGRLADRGDCFTIVSYPAAIKTIQEAFGCDHLTRSRRRSAHHTATLGALTPRVDS